MDKPKARRYRRTKWDYRPAWECAGVKSGKLVIGYGSTLDEAFRNRSKS